MSDAVAGHLSNIGVLGVAGLLAGVGSLHRFRNYCGYVVMLQPPRLPGLPHQAAVARARGPEAEAGTEAGAGPVPTVLMCSHLRLVFLGLVLLTSR